MSKKVKFISSLRVNASDLTPPTPPPTPPVATPPKPAAPPVDDINDFARGPISKVEEVGQGTHEPRHHTIGKHKVITKSDPASVGFEALGHDMGKEFGIRVPRTVNRDLPNRDGKVVPHSAQELVKGESGSDIYSHEPLREDANGNMSHIPQSLSNHPDMIKMVMWDRLMGNEDRNVGNYIHDEDTNQIHAIDNGGLMSGYDPLHQDQDSLSKDNLHNVDGDIPEDFRQRVLAADPAHHAAIIVKHLDTPHGQAALTGNDTPYLEDIQDTYQQRLMEYKKHMANPNIRTVQHFRDALFPKKIT